MLADVGVELIAAVLSELVVIFACGLCCVPVRGRGWWLLGMYIDDDAHVAGNCDAAAFVG